MRKITRTCLVTFVPELSWRRPYVSVTFFQSTRDDVVFCFLFFVLICFVLCLFLFFYLWRHQGGMRGHLEALLYTCPLKKNKWQKSAIFSKLMDICPLRNALCPLNAPHKKKKSGAAIVSMTDLFLKYSDYNVLQHSSTGGIFCNTSTDGGWLPPLPWIFAMKPPILMILVLQDR